MMSQGWKTWIGVLLLVLAWSGHAAEPLPVLVIAPDNPQTMRFRAALEAAPERPVEIVAEAADARLVLALGEAAFAEALRGPLPVIGVHVAEQVVADARAAGCRCTAIYREPDMAAQLLVLREMLPGARRVGVLLGPHSARQQAALSAPGLLFEVRRVDRADDLPAVLGDLLSRVDVLLALPDASLYNADTARLLLLASYRQNTPVIGPDEQFVRAGSLAAAQPSADALIEATLMLLQHPGLPEQLPPPRHARSSLSFNARVARSYGVITPDIDAIGQRLESMP
jgi:putative tryptophan/tyrosine transport system substrate-binding protein